MGMVRVIPQSRYIGGFFMSDEEDPFLPFDPRWFACGPMLLVFIVVLIMALWEFGVFHFIGRVVDMIGDLFNFSPIF